MLPLWPASIRRHDSCMSASRTPTRPVLPPVRCRPSCRLPPTRPCRFSTGHAHLDAPPVAGILSRSPTGTASVRLSELGYIGRTRWSGTGESLGRLHPAGDGVVTWARGAWSMVSRRPRRLNGSGGGVVVSPYHASSWSPSSGRTF